MLTIENITTRRSTPRLGLPAPTPDQMLKVWQCALTAPDHGCLRPWRFIVIEGPAREKLGDVFERSAVESDPQLAENKRQKLRSAPLRAPMLVVAVAQVIKDHKVPVQEQVVAVGCAVQNMQLALHEMGYASMWRTGDMAYQAGVKKALGLNPTDEIVAYVYIGTEESTPKERSDLDIVEFVSDWK